MVLFEFTPLPIAIYEKPAVTFSEPPSVDRLGSIASILGLVVALVAYRRTVANAEGIGEIEHVLDRRA